MDLGEVRLVEPSPALAANAPGSPAQGRVEGAQRDVVALGIATASIIMFVGNGGTVLSQAIRSWMGVDRPPDQMLVNALLLNVALLIFGWRRYVDLMREVEERRHAEEQACLLALTDPLTGCLNRRSVGPATDGLLALAREGSSAVAILLFDLDNFKNVNDVSGHRAGDALLSAIAARTQAALPAGSVLARLGGDEFAAAVPFDPARPEAVDRIAETLIREAAQGLEHEGVLIETTLSVGIASSDRIDGGDGVIDAQLLLHNADIAMYHAKKAGRNRHHWFEPEMANELRLRSELETGIRRGLGRGEFVPYYEQQIDLESGDLVGFEMLARWNSPSLGLVGPDIFIPIAEEIGVIAEMSEQLIAQALRDAAEWDPALTLSVNISPIQLRDPWFAQRILRLLVEANFPPSRLEIEITESCLHENVGLVQSLVTSLKNQGIAISLDDFGTGYSSLTQLQTLPFDRIKIDRSFVTSLGSSAESAPIVETIASLGKRMSLPITAEGIETREALEALRAYGKLKGQGYLYGRPVEAAKVRDLLAERGLLLHDPQRDTLLDLRPAREDAPDKASGTHG
ncbi:MAG: EAL domain-containing protein [Novosphingobium sp.]|nr:EAL domain-containing protein [Novosphingobium sp.]